jgi:hypothetical protein
LRGIEQNERWSCIQKIHARIYVTPML